MINERERYTNSVAYPCWHWPDYPEQPQSSQPLSVLWQSDFQQTLPLLSPRYICLPWCFLQKIHTMKNFKIENDPQSINSSSELKDGGEVTYKKVSALILSPILICNKKRGGGAKPPPPLFQRLCKHKLSAKGGMTHVWNKYRYCVLQIIYTYRLKFESDWATKKKICSTWIFLDIMFYR